MPRGIRDIKPCHLPIPRTDLPRPPRNITSLRQSSFSRQAQLVNSTTHTPYATHSDSNVTGTLLNRPDPEGMSARIHVSEPSQTQSKLETSSKHTRFKTPAHRKCTKRRRWQDSTPTAEILTLLWLYLLTCLCVPVANLRLVHHGKKCPCTHEQHHSFCVWQQLAGSRCTPTGNTLHVAIVAIVPTQIHRQCKLMGAPRVRVLLAGCAQCLPLWHLDMQSTPAAKDLQCSVRHFWKHF